MIMSTYTINPPIILIIIDPNCIKWVWYNVNGNEIPLTSKTPVKNLHISSNVVGLFPWSLLNVKKSSLRLSIDSAIMFGNGAIKNITITHNGFQLLYNAHDNSINKNPDARNAERNIILFNGFI